MLNLKKSENSHGASNRKILVILLVFLSAALFCNVAKANTLTDGISSVFNFINTKIIDQIKKDFCNQFVLHVSNGDWKEGELRTNIGKTVCASSTPSAPAEKIAKDAIQPLNENFAVSKTETLSTSSVNNPIPDVYVPNPALNGSDLNIDEIIYWTNLNRKNNDSNLVNLKENSVLTKIAVIRVKDMFTNNYFEHDSPTGDNASKEAVKNGYGYITIGENIALGSFDDSQSLVTAWMNSPGHRANILNKNYTEIGIYAQQGIYKGKNVWIAAQIFGKPISGCIEPDKILKDKITKYKVSADSILTDIKNMDVELKIINSADIQTYNLKVAERNTLAKSYNKLTAEIKSSMVEYNKEVVAYNLCIKTL